MVLDVGTTAMVLSCTVGTTSGLDFMGTEKGLHKMVESCTAAITATMSRKEKEKGGVKLESPTKVLGKMENPVAMEKCTTLGLGFVFTLVKC